MSKLKLEVDTSSALFLDNMNTCVLSLLSAVHTLVEQEFIVNTCLFDRTFQRCSSMKDKCLCSSA